MDKPFLKKTISAIIILFTCLLAYSQKPLPRVITGEDFLGKYLPPRVYDIEIDAKGFVYLVYPGGIWVFNGHETKSDWKQKNPYDPNIYFALHKGYNDQILLSGPFGVAYVKGDSIVKFSIPDSLVQSGRIGYESVYTDEDGLLHISPRNKGYFTVDSLGITEEIVGQSSGIHGFVASQLEDGKVFSYSISQGRAKNKTYSLYSSLYGSTLKYITDVEVPRQETSLVQHKDGTHVFSNGKNDLVHFGKNGLIHALNFEYNVIKLFIDNRDVLWVGTGDNGFLKMKSLQVKENYLEGSCAVLAESFDNGLWIKSSKSKFGYISPLNVLNYSDQNGYPHFMDITEVQQFGEQTIISNESHQFFTLDGDDVKEIIPPGIEQCKEIPKVDRVPGRFCFDQKMNKFWVTYFGELQSWDGKKWEVLKFDENDFKSQKVFALKAFTDGRVIGATQHEMFEIENGEINRISDHTKAKIQNITIDDNDKYWIGTLSGIWTLEDGKFVRPFEKMLNELLTPSQFITYSQGAVWYQPSLDGLYVINQDSIIPVFDQHDRRIKLYTSSVSPNGDLWGIIREGGKLCQLELRNDSINFHYYEIDDLAMYHIKHGFLATDKDIFIGGTHGLFKCPIDELTTVEIPSKVEFTEIRINHEEVSIIDSYKLPYYKNYINVTFDGISFRRIPLTYSYQMQGLETVWRETKHKHVQYTNLPPGKYDFKLRVKTSQSDWTIPKTITFTIEKPYWQKWWFRLICIISFLILSLLGIQLWVNNVRKKEAEKGKIALELSRLELRALKAQMNPHFVFNTLKSIQNRILKEGKWEANDLLVRFSKLIRSSLEYSRVDFITLNKEIDFISNYLEIEKQRIPGKFDFEILIDNIEDIQDFLVPSLLIQPICENAINHAFEEGKGNLIIKMKLISHDLIEVIITDDGIGYFKIKNIDKDTKHSRGLEIVQSRLELFKLQGYDTSILIEPLNEKTKQGTKITLRLPCK